MSRAFIDQSRRLLSREYLPRIERCVRELSEEDLWWRPNEQSNSVGNLLLHLAGNLGQWILHGVGDMADTRRRQSEFDAYGGESAASLLDALRDTVTEVDRVLADLPPGRLDDRRCIQGVDVTIREAVYHAVEHFSGHVGQIIYITKMRRDIDLGFYTMNADGTVRRGWH